MSHSSPSIRRSTVYVVGLTVPGAEAVVEHVLGAESPSKRALHPLAGFAIDRPRSMTRAYLYPESARVVALSKAGARASAYAADIEQTFADAGYSVTVQTEPPAREGLS